MEKLSGWTSKLKERVSVLPLNMSLDILIGHEVQERALCLIGRDTRTKTV